MKTRSSITALLAVAVASAIVTGAHTARADLKLIVTHSVPPLVPNSVMDLAEVMGIYKQVGLELEIIRVQQTPSAVAALRSGAGDMANIATSTALQLVARDQMKLRTVVSPDKAIPFLIAAKKTFGSVKSLESGSFAVGRIGSLDYTLSRLVLTSRGVDVDKLQMVAIGQPNMRAQSLVGGRVDATTMSVGVWTGIQDKSAVHVLVPHADYFEAAPILSKVNVVTEETLGKKRDEIRKFIKAIVILSRQFAEKPELWADEMAKINKEVPRAELVGLAREYARSWSVNGGLNLSQVAYTTESEYARDDYKDLRRVEPSEWVVTELIDDVLKEVGTASGSDATGR